MERPRSRTERGWRLAGLLVLFVIACFWMPLGARDAGGVSAVIPALRPSTLAQPHRATAHVTAQPRVGRATPTVRTRAPLGLAVLGLVLLALRVVLVGPAADDLRSGRRLGAVRSRGPPAVV